MKRGSLKFTLMLLAILYLQACGGNSDEDCFCEQNIVDTLSGTGIVSFNSVEGKWAIEGIDSITFNYVCFPKSLPEEFQKEGTKVNFKGDLYDYHHVEHDGYIIAVVGLNYYCIDLINIEKSE